MTQEAFLAQMEVLLKRDFTEEQTDFITHLTEPGICFASPGTGKTASAVAGLIFTELHKQIPGENIYALSFANMATLELSVRHLEACKKLGIKQRVNFQTLHKLCVEILQKNYTLLGLNRLTISSSFTIDSLANLVIEFCREQNIDLKHRNIRNTIRAVRTLNSSLTFAQENVESRVCFKDTGLAYEDFMKIRKLLYDFNKVVESIQVDDILLYTLELLLTHPEVAEEFKKNCKIMVIDEAQDLSLLQLRIISTLTDCPVLIGDIKQQIYAFNGACQEIVGQFFKYFPGAWKKEFTQSFRCRNEIAEFATPLIIPNKVGGETFKGIGNGGVVTVEKGIDYSSLCKKIADDFLDNKHTFEKDILFLFRNNISATPIIEEFYKLKVPFRVNRFKPATQIPVISDLCAISELALQPNSIDMLPALSILIPEFRAYTSITDTPFYRIMRSKHCSIFDIKYNFKNDYGGSMVMSMLMDIHEMLLKGKCVADIFNQIFPLYKDFWLKDREHFMEYPASHYMMLANYAFHGKNYTQFRQDELGKEAIINDYNNRRFGVRCYTFHAAKGLEADIVYLLDCEDHIIPNARKFNEMCLKGCTMDAAREVRNERSLVYVACTRAKEELHIRYNNELSSLFTGKNNYLSLDMEYESFVPNYSDVEVFQDFYSGGLVSG